MGAIERAFTSCGFETIIITGLPNPNQDFAAMVMAKRWPDEWFKLYTKNRYDRVDPVVRLCRKSSAPFEWSEAPYNPDAEPRAAEVMRRATDFRMSKGFITPIHGLEGFEAAISLGGQDVDLNARSKPALHLMSLYAFERVRKLMAAEYEPAVKLTAREREVLSWAAEGKTSDDISAILHITRRTVEEHFVTAGRKLGSCNRTHAVAIAIRGKLIAP